MTRLETLLRKHTPDIDIQFVTPILTGLESIRLPLFIAARNESGDILLDEEGEPKMSPTECVQVPFWVGENRARCFNFRVPLSELMEIEAGKEVPGLVAEWEGYLMTVREIIHQRGPDATGTCV